MVGLSRVFMPAGVQRMIDRDQGEEEVKRG
jgi:hypothetical protein